MVDANGKPFSLAPLRHVIRRILSDRSGRFEILLSDSSRLIRSPSLSMPAPLIVRCKSYVETTQHERTHFSRAVMFARDEFTCQYCGYQPKPGRVYKELTVDHVRPAHLFSSRAAATSYINCTTACAPCNNVKGGRLPMQAGMYPKRAPRVPTFVQLRFGDRLDDQQRSYVDDYYAAEGAGS